MARIIDLNLAALAEEALLRRVKEQAVDNITKKLLQEYEQKVRSMVQAEVEKITLGTLQHMRDVAGMREAIHVTFEYKQ